MDNTREVVMGTIEKSGEAYHFRQDDGEITARFESIEEKMVLSHEGSPHYKRVFNVLVLVGILYLAAIFIFI
jgi:hypothetical protein